MRRAPFPLVLALALLAAVSGSAGAQSIHVTPLQRDGQVLVSFTLADGFDEDVRAAIRSGLATSLTYEVSLLREATLWFDHTIAEAEVTATVKYDNLTRRYQVSRTVGGRMEAPPQVTDSEDVVRALMTSFDKLALFTTERLEANEEYDLRVRARASPRASWSIWPWGRHHASGRATFTFIP
jgi:hypothetical protein